MKIVEGIEALLGNNFTGQIEIIFDLDSAVTNYKVSVLDGKLVFANEDIKRHFIVTVVNQDIDAILFKRIK